MHECDSEAECVKNLLRADILTTPDTLRSLLGFWGFDRILCKQLPTADDPAKRQH